MLTTKLTRYFPDAECLGLDIETQGLDFWKDRVVMIQLSDGVDAVSIDVRRFTPYGEPAYSELSLWLEQHVFDRYLIIQNGLFDLTMLRYWYGVDYPTQGVWDTKLAEAVRYCGLDVSSSLDEIVLREFGVALDKTLQTSFLPENGFDYATSEIDPEQVKYGEDDVRYLPEIMERQKRVLGREDLLYITGIENDVMPVFCEMRLRGIQVELDRLMPLLEEAKQERDEVLVQIQEILTPYIYYDRLRKYKDEIRPRVEYKSRVREITEQVKQEWFEAFDHMTSSSLFVTDDGVVEWPEDWVENKYNDPKPHKKGHPWGCQRFINDALKEFRAVHGGMPGKPNFSPFDPINPGSPDQMKLAFSNMGIDLKDTTKGTLKALLGETEDQELQELLSLVLAFRKKNHLINSFGANLIEMMDGDHRLHGDFNQIVSTGRPSSRKPNMLNMPHDPRFRSCFVAPEGYKLVVADYSQIEYRIMAELAGERWIIDAYKQGVDFHTRKAAQVFGVDEEDVTEEQRKVAKIFNFGRNYGMMENTLRANMAEEHIYVTKEQAKEWVRKDDAAAPKVVQFRRQQGQLALRRGWVSTPFGRKRYFDLGEIRNKWDEYSVVRRASNMPIQGGNADIMKLAMVIVQDAIRPYGASIVLQIYDELVVETPEEYAEEVAQMVVAGMIAAGEMLLKEIPVEVDCVISPSWSEKEGTEVAA